MTEKISPERSSAFSQLTSKRVETPKPKEKQPPPERVDAAQTRTSALKESVENNDEARAAITSISSNSAKREVAEANEASSRSTVRDVDRAAELAQDVAKQISANQDQALKAQKSPTEAVVSSLLR